MDELCDAGLSDEMARKSLEVVYQWLEEKYPVLATIARPTVMKELTTDRQQEQTF